MKYSSIKKTLTTLTLSSIVLSSLIACGKKSSSSAPSQFKQEEKIETEINGTYLAILSPLNKSVGGNIVGALTVAREGDEFVGDVRLTGGAPSILHAQNIHIGSRCPTLEDDINQDGFIDAVEGALVYDKVIIPLDGDLNSQRMDSGIFPLADEFGNYVYSEAASFEHFMADLYEKDLNDQDLLVNLHADEKLILVGKVVVIQGILPTTPLPATVLSNSRLQNYQTLPIACGVITKIRSAPGSVDSDSTDIDVPTGETVGGSSGSDDGSIFTPGDINPLPEPGSTGGATGGTPGDYGDEEEGGGPVSAPAPIPEPMPFPTPEEPTPTEIL